MPAERIKRQIDRLLDKIDDAVARDDWPAVGNLAERVLTLDPGNEDAAAYREAAVRGHDGGVQRAAPSTAGVASSRMRTTEMRDQPPATLPGPFVGGRYKIEAFIGEGSRKRVYRARDTRLDRAVAFAVIKTDGLDSDGLLRLQREAQAMGRLGDHPHIVTVFDVGEEAGQQFIVSQYMAGGDVEGLLRQSDQRRLPIPRVLQIAEELCRALEHAHSNGIIHRDLKPANIWLAEDGSAQLGDFGLALTVRKPGMTLEGTLLGTVAYMSPEQATGGDVDARSDLYALGCVLYEMIAGRPPFVGDDAVRVISQHLNTAPLSPAQHNPACPPDLDVLIQRLLAKHAEERPASAAEVRQALAALDLTRRATSTFSNPLDRLAYSVFVGREQELMSLRAGFSEASRGRGSVLMLAGEPGIGKTRTAQELETYARMHRAQVLWGRAYEAEGAPAYWPWVQAIRSYAAAIDPGQLRVQLGSGAAEVARIAPEVRDLLPGLPEAQAGSDPAAAQFRLFDAVSTFLSSAAAANPLVIVLEDLHWADRPTLLLLKHIARDVARARVLVLGTYRDVDPDSQHALEDAVGELEREQLYQRIRLRGLSASEITELLASVAQHEMDPAGEALARTLHSVTEGNPFFIEEIVRHLVETGVIYRRGDRLVSDVRTLDELKLPAGVLGVISRRLSHLSEPCNVLLTTAAVMGRTVRVEALAQVTDLDDATLTVLIEEACGARVLGEVPHDPGTFSFTHALIRETLRRGLTAARRARLHSQIGDALEILYADSPEAHLGELAYHFFEGARGGGDVERAIDYARRAGERAASLMAHDEAAEQFTRALEAMGWRGKPDDAEICRLTLSLGEAQHRAGETSGARNSFQAAAELARKVDAPDLLGRAALGYIGSGMVTGQRDETLLSLLEEALAALGDVESPLRARVQARLASALYFSAADRERRVRLSEAAVDIAKRIGDPQTLAYTLTALHRTLWVADTLERRIDVANELVGAASASGDIDVALEGHGWIFVDLAELGDIPGAMAHLDFYVRLAEGLKQPIHGWATTLQWAMLALFSGEHERAEQLCNDALALGQKAQSPNAFPLYGGQLLHLRRQQGRSAEMIPLAQNVVRQFPTVAAWSVALALLYCDVENREAARAEVEPHVASDYQQINYDNLWLGTMASLCLIAGYLDDARIAGALYERLQQFAGRNVIIANAIVSLGSMSRYLGVLATVLERWDRAVEHFRHAIAFNTAIGAMPYTLFTQVDFARMLLRRGGRGDARSASALLNDALTGAQAIGMAGVVTDALELKMRAQGLGGHDPKESIEAVAAVVEAEQPNLVAQTAPDGTVTLLFSDIEASSTQNERLGDARWMELLRIHNRVVREQIAAYDGYEVKSMGDGFMLAFRSASQALRCAIAIQRAFSAQDAGAPDRIVVRIGLHTGEAIREADDFFGKHVNLAARIGGAALGGEILVSALLRELTASAGEFRFGPAREVELRGLAGRQMVYAVEWS